MIELQHLMYFVAVAEEGSIRAAAPRLHLTQPPLSRHMRALEERVGVQLLTRTPRGVSLTPAGEVLLVEANEILAKVGLSLERVQRAAEGVRQIRFGYAGSAGIDLIPAVIAALARSTPPIDVELVELPYDRPLAAFARLSCDAAFVRVPAGGETEGAARSISCETLRHDRTVLVVPLGHRLAGAGKVDLDALEGEDLIVTAGSRATVLAAAKRYSLRIRSVREAATIPAVAGLVASGRGVGRMAETTPLLHHDEVVSVPISGYTSTVVMAWAGTLSERVRDQIRAAAARVVASDPPEVVWTVGSRPADAR